MLKTLQDTPPWEWPEDTANVLLGVLQGDQASDADRLVAAELAADVIVINDELVDVLLNIVGNASKSNELRCQAALSLGPALEDADLADAADDQEGSAITRQAFNKIQETMRRLYDDQSTPKEVRRRILEASVRSPQDWHEKAIREAYASGDEAWKLTAVFCMRYVRGFDKEILEALQNRKNEDIFREAVGAAGSWGVDGAWPTVSALVGDPQTPKSLLLEAIEAVAGIRPKDAFTLLDGLTDSEDEDIAEAAAEALAIAEIDTEDEVGAEDES